MVNKNALEALRRTIEGEDAPLKLRRAPENVPTGLQTPGMGILRDVCGVLLPPQYRPDVFSIT
jgi:hypothetical protein